MKTTKTRYAPTCCGGRVMRNDGPGRGMLGPDVRNDRPVAEHRDDDGWRATVAATPAEAEAVRGFSPVGSASALARKLARAS